MEKSRCKECINREICGSKEIKDCEHYDVALTRSEIFTMLNEVKINNPAIIPSILGAVQKVYRINLAY